MSADDRDLIISDNIAGEMKMVSDDLPTKLGIATYIGTGNGRSIHNIAEHFGISIRTAYRFLDRLQAEGYPLTNEGRKNGKEKLWTMLDAHSDQYGNALPSSEFSQEERILLHYVMADLRKSEEILPSFKSVRNKLATMLSQKTVAFPSLDYSKNISRKLFPIENISSISKIASKGTQRIVAQILEAISGRNRICMTYHVPNKTTVLEVGELSPVFAFFFDGGMYLQTLLENRELRTYAIERIECISIIKDSVAMKPDFDPCTLLTDPFGPFIGRRRIEAKVWIAFEQVQYVKERKWPDNVIIRDNEDGSVIFEATTYAEWEFLNWILSMRTQAELLEPEWLREELSFILDRTAALYHTLM